MQFTTISSRRSGSRVVSLLAGGALVLAACGSGSSGGESSDVASIGSTPDAASAEPSAQDSTQEPVSEEEAVADAEKAFEDYQQCLSDLGIDDGVFISFGDGEGAAVDGEVTEAVEADGAGDGSFSDITPEQIEQMQEECDPILANIDNGFDLSPEQEAEFRDAELAFAQCMRENGLEDFPDPAARGADVEGEASTGLGGAIEIGEGDFEAFEEAAEACDHIFEELGGIVVGS